MGEGGVRGQGRSQRAFVRLRQRWLNLIFLYYMWRGGGRGRAGPEGVCASEAIKARDGNVQGGHQGTISTRIQGRWHATGNTRRVPASRAPRRAAPHGAVLRRAHLPPLPLLSSGTRSCSTRPLAVSSTLRAGANARAPVGAAGSTLATMTLSGSRGWGRLRVQLDVCAPGGALVSFWQWLRVTAHDRHGLPVGALPGPAMLGRRGRVVPARRVRAVR